MVQAKCATALGSLADCTKQCGTSQGEGTCGGVGWSVCLGSSWWMCPCAHPSSAEYESDAWDLERTKLQEKHQLTKRQLEEAFLLHEHQMTERHKKVLRLAQLIAHPYPTHCCHCEVVVWRTKDYLWLSLPSPPPPLASPPLPFPRSWNSMRDSTSSSTMTCSNGTNWSGGNTHGSSRWSTGITSQNSRGPTGEGRTCHLYDK